MFLIYTLNIFTKHFQRICFHLDFVFNFAIYLENIVCACRNKVPNTCNNMLHAILRIIIGGSLYDR